MRDHAYWKRHSQGTKRIMGLSPSQKLMHALGIVNDRDVLESVSESESDNPEYGKHMRESIDKAMKNLANLLKKFS